MKQLKEEGNNSKFVSVSKRCGSLTVLCCLLFNGFESLPVTNASAYTCNIKNCEALLFYNNFFEHIHIVI